MLEDALSGGKKLPNIRVIIVLILIMLEDALSAGFGGLGFVLNSQVLILIMLEDALSDCRNVSLC